MTRSFAALPTSSRFTTLGGTLFVFALPEDGAGKHVTAQR